MNDAGVGTARSLDSGSEGGPDSGQPSIGISLIVPTWNEEQALPRLLQATRGAADVLDRPDEIVVVDGGSSDRTRALAEAEGCLVIQSEKGRGRQLAAGAEAARCDLLAFLHADSSPQPGAMAAIRAAFRDPEVKACSFAQVVGAEGRFYRWVENIADRRARRGWVYGDSGLVIRRSTYDAIGGYGPQAIFEDLELSKRLRARAQVHLPAGARIGVSARRWKREGATWTVIRNWILTHLWRAGVNPRFLARFYPTEPLVQPDTGSSAPKTSVESP